MIAKATIKFLDFDIPTGKTELMVGIKRVTISMTEWRIFHHLLGEWDSGLSRFPSSQTTYVFNAKKAFRAEGKSKAALICEMLGIQGQLA